VEADPMTAKDALATIYNGKPLPASFYVSQHQWAEASQRFYKAVDVLVACVRERDALAARVAELEVQLADAQSAHRHQADYSARLERHLFALKESARAVCEGTDAGEIRLGLSILRAALAAQTKAAPTTPASSASTPHP
jgi:hypothetical protein